MTSRLLLGDCLARVADLADNTFDAIVCDPPYHLTTGKKGGSGPRSVNLNHPAGRARIGAGFMGKAWDGGDVAFRVETWAAMLRVAKPGAHLIAFGGTRTHHRLTCAIEDAGWEIRDALMWLYGSGYPKSLNVAKKIDESLGRADDRAVVSTRDYPDLRGDDYGRSSGKPRVAHSETAPASDEARQWAGWGTALKPAFEPIVLARKPFTGTVAANVLQHGTGALNINGCRIDGAKGSGVWGSSNATIDESRMFNASPAMREYRSAAIENDDGRVGRWPANVLLDEEAAQLLDASAPASGPTREGFNTSGSMAGPRLGMGDRAPAFHGDKGGASRFYYTSKASQAERGEGNTHPTVKPLDLMQWLVRLVTPRGGLVLDPFAGSGTTLLAADAEGCHSVGIELEPEHCATIQRRFGLFAPELE